jgi:catechol 2,3-dioxygenase-like lactoylglutathione lyase family enzyme
MRIKGIEHVSINVTDMQASLAFYSDTLGLKREETVSEDGFNITYYRLPDGRRLELFDYNGTNPFPARGESDVGLRHLAFEVEDVAEAENELRTKGARITLPTIDLPELGARVLLFLDPNGVTLEFCQKLPVVAPAGKNA